MTTDSLITYFSLHETALRLKVSLQVAQWWSDSGILESFKDKYGSTLISKNSIDGLLRDEQLFEQKVSQMQIVEPSLKMLIVEDDGRGMSQPPPQGQLGLLGIRERLELIGGEMKIETAPGEGTAIFVRIPLPAALLKGEAA